MFQRRTNAKQVISKSSWGSPNILDHKCDSPQKSTFYSGNLKTTLLKGKGQVFNDEITPLQNSEEVTNVSSFMPGKYTWAKICTRASDRGRGSNRISSFWENKVVFTCKWENNLGHTQEYSISVLSGVHLQVKYNSTLFHSVGETKLILREKYGLRRSLGLSFPRGTSLVFWETRKEALRLIPKVNLGRCGIYQV